MRNQTLLLFALLFVLTSCSENDNSNQNPLSVPAFDSVFQNAPAAKEDTLIIKTPLKSDTSEIHIFQKGETLWDLSEKYYGNRHYSSILSIYNGIEDVNRIESGTEIKIPTLNEILIDESFGLVPQLEKEVFKILAARQLYMEDEKILWHLRRESDWKGKQNLPESVIDNLERAAALIDLTIVQLSQPEENSTSIPNKMINNLKSVSRNLKHLASGANDGYGYDLDMVHQDLIRAIHNGKSWVEKNNSN